MPSAPADPLGLLILLLISPAVGSFLGVLADRLPQGEDILRRPSACRSCGHRLGSADLIPILSFLLQRGCCRHCGGIIPAWLLYLEIAASGLAILAVLAGGPTVWIWHNALVLWLLLGLAATDLLHFRLPNLLTAALALVALLRATQPEGPDLLVSLIGAAAGSGLLLCLRLGYRMLRGREGLGLGDVKLGFGLGALTGPTGLPMLFLLAALVGLGLGFYRAWYARQRLAASAPVPFGTALATAAFAIWVWTGGTF